MLYRALLIGLVGGAAAQDCAGADAGTNACACYMVTCADVTSMGTPVSLTTTLGPVTGRSQGGVDRFFGVPIAASSAGANRFKTPQSTSWTTAVETTVEKMCPLVGYPIGGTEDCLGVDVMKPSSGSSLPAAMWIHGGGFYNENPFFYGVAWGPHQQYSFSHLPNGGSIVTVLAHYRLGALGWMAHPGFAAETNTFMGGSTTGSGNYGMSDTINVIKWISDNAAHLGVDSTKITVFGESAGAAHVTMLIASPLTNGLVYNFIAQSPFISFGDATFSHTARMTMDTLYTMRTKCTTTPTVSSGSTATAEAACLRAAPITDLISDFGFNTLISSFNATAAFDAVYGAGASALFLYNSIHIWPVVDGYIMTLPPLSAYASGINAGANIIIGHNSDEYSTFCYSYPFAPIAGTWACGTMPDAPNQGWIFAMFYLDVSATWDQIFAATNAVMSGTKIAQLGAGLFYNDIIDHVEMMGVQMGTDAWFANGNKMAIEALLSAPGRATGTIYHFVFAQETDTLMSKMGACHGCELTYVLGFFKVSQTYLSSQTPPSMGVGTVVPTGGSTLVGNAMNAYWSSMWYYGTPNTVGSGLPTWSPMSQSDKQTMTFQDSYPAGALMNPCVRWAMCRTEQAKDWRFAQKQFFSTSPSEPSLAMPVCTSAPVGTTTHMNSAENGLTCSFLPCCTYTSMGRRMLFGMPSTTAATACDSMC
jgi:carboxylesterase type B